MGPKMTSCSCFRKKCYDASAAIECSLRWIKQRYDLRGSQCYLRDISGIRILSRKRQQQQKERKQQLWATFIVVLVVYQTSTMVSIVIFLNSDGDCLEHSRSSQRSDTSPSRFTTRIVSSAESCICRCGICDSIVLRLSSSRCRSSDSVILFVLLAFIFQCWSQIYMALLFEASWNCLLSHLAIVSVFGGGH